MEIFMVFGGFGQRKTKPIQSQFVRIAYCVMRIAKRHLKKQSQFVSARIGVNSFMEGNYGNKRACGAEKKQSQFHVPETTKEAKKKKKVGRSS